jgi:hypothetical protein
METDFILNDHGSIMILKPITAEAESWVENHIPSDALWWANGVVIEPRYVPDFVQGIMMEGLAIDA